VHRLAGSTSHAINIGPACTSTSWLYCAPQARNNSDSAPLVLWLTGGPGCSSELAVFVENGPYMLNDKGEVEERKYAWDVEVSASLESYRWLGTIIG
jgi:cathepsin A (carboxypeptidase C)